MMKQTIPIFLALLVIFSPLQKAWLVVSYELNKDYIATTFCENKEKPKLQCDGQCHLKKQLDKTEKEEQKLPTSQKEKVSVLFFAEVTSFSFYFTQKPIANAYNEFYENSKPQVATTDIFQPPRS